PPGAFALVRCAEVPPKPMIESARTTQPAPPIVMRDLLILLVSLCSLRIRTTLYAVVRGADHRAARHAGPVLDTVGCSRNLSLFAAIQEPRRLDFLRTVRETQDY